MAKSLEKEYEVLRDKLLGHRGPYAGESEESNTLTATPPALTNRVIACEGGRVARDGDLYFFINKECTITLTIQEKGWYEWVITTGAESRTVRSIGEAETASKDAGFGRDAFYRLAHRLP